MASLMACLSFLSLLAGYCCSKYKALHRTSGVHLWSFGEVHKSPAGGAARGRPPLRCCVASDISIAFAHPPGDDVHEIPNPNSFPVFY